MPPIRSCRNRVLAALVALPLAALMAGPGSLPADAAPRAAVDAAPPAVALGDSFASGEGLSPYRDGTDTATDQCHRSDQAYPALVESTEVRRLQDVTSVACSGATTGTVVAGSAAEPSQLAALSRQTRTVTLTVGGNDIGFAQVLNDCIYSPRELGLVAGRPGCAERNNQAVRAATNYLAGKPGARKPVPSAVSLPRLLARIHAKAPKARIYVTGYPRLFGLQFTDPEGCRVGDLDQVGQVPLYITESDVRWFRRKSNALNEAISTSVAKARRQGVYARYVDVSDRFTSHNVCSTGTPWINSLLFTLGNPVTVSPASFHPNAQGQQAYADAVADAVAGRPRT